MAAIPEMRIAPVADSSPPYRTQLFRVPSADSSRFATKYTAQFAINDPDVADPSQARHESKSWRFEPKAWKIYVPRTRWMIVFAAITVVQGLALTSLLSYTIPYFQSILVGIAPDTDFSIPCVDACDDPEIEITSGSTPGVVVSDTGVVVVAKGVVLGQAIIGIFEAFYQILLVLDAGRRKNIVQIIGVCLNNASMLTLVAIALSGVRSSINSLVSAAGIEAGWQQIISIYKAMIGLLALGSSSMAVVACLGFREFEWSVYRHISSADTRLRRLYLNYEILVAMLHLDFFFLFGFWVQILVLEPVGREPEGRLKDMYLVFSVLGLLSVIFALILTAYAIRKESRTAAVMGALFLLLEFGVLTGRIALMWISPLPPGYETFSERVLGYGIVALVFLLATAIVAARCWFNFNKGLKMYLQQASLPGGEFGRDRARDPTISGPQSQVLLHSRMDLD